MRDFAEGDAFFMIFLDGYCSIVPGFVQICRGLFVLMKMNGKPEKTIRAAAKNGVFARNGAKIRTSFRFAREGMPGISEYGIDFWGHGSTLKGTKLIIGGSTFSISGEALLVFN